MNKINIGWINGFIGVAIFAGSLPATRIAVIGFSPEFLTTVRALIAGFIGLMCLLLLKETKPNFQQFKSLTIVALGVVIGFPLFTALALQSVTSSHAIVFVGLLPLATAIFAVLRGGEKPNLQFWLFAILGSTCVMGYMFYQNQNFNLNIGDFYMLIAVISCGLGYAEGGKLSKDLGGWQVISWALVITLPLMSIGTIYYFPNNFNAVQTAQILGLIYVSVFSMWLGFLFWYKGLAQGGIAKVGQIQLLQPFIGFYFSYLLLNEKIDLSMIVVCIATIICVALAKKFA